jgi:exopolysaccharide production protein ExoQ
MSIITPPQGAPYGLINRGRLRQAASPALGVPLRLLFVAFLIFDFPAFTIQLAMDPATGRWTGSPVMKVMTIGSELFVVALMLSSRNIRSLVFQSWPIWSLVVIALVSSAWSRNVAATIHDSNTYMTTALFGLTLAGAMPQFQCVRFVIRTMVLGCVLSLLWVILFPEVAIHQQTDLYQTVHAGLWRGIFSHKQGLGYHSGLTIGLLLFYRTSIFPLPIWVASLAVSVACLIGSGSATGFVAAVITPALLYVAYFVTRCPAALRRVMVLKLALGAVGLGLAYKVGLLNFVIVGILGKSLDLTGRADIWPIVLERFHSTGLSLLGGGFGADLASTLSEWSVDNGYIDKFIELGYVFSPVVYVIFAATLWAAIRLILEVRSEDVRAAIFPFAIWSVTLLLNITESNFMTKCLSTVLASMAVGIIVQNRQLIRSKLSYRVAGRVR